MFYRQYHKIEPKLRTLALSLASHPKIADEILTNTLLDLLNVYLFRDFALWLFERSTLNSTIPKSSPVFQAFPVAPNSAPISARALVNFGSKSLSTSGRAKSRGIAIQRSCASTPNSTAASGSEGQDIERHDRQLFHHYSFDRSKIAGHCGCTVARCTRDILFTITK